MKKKKNTIPTRNVYTLIVVGVVNNQGTAKTYLELNIASLKIKRDDKFYSHLY